MADKGREQRSVQENLPPFSQPPPARALHLELQHGRFHAGDWDQTGRSVVSECISHGICGPQQASQDRRANEIGANLFIGNLDPVSIAPTPLSISAMARARMHLCSLLYCFKPHEGPVRAVVAPQCCFSTCDRLVSM